MSKMIYRAQPMSRAKLRQLAIQFRSLLGIEDVYHVNVLKILEHVMPMLFEGFTYEIVQIQELPMNRHADTDVINRIIRIREDIYDKACKNDGQARMTIMHEIAHYLLFVVCGVKFARSFADKPVKTYEDPEWQAKAFAAEIMCDYRLVRHMSPDMIKDECGVSWSAANMIFRNCRKL
ncbi:MAG: ImmA/IrrE family metallo-endopeptidase [Clostridia bacterium]|nr:ImmA/IrrE family metallo-endopeptidase [Clostridia bacterium]